MKEMLMQMKSSERGKVKSRVMKRLSMKRKGKWQ